MDIVESVEQAITAKELRWEEALIRLGFCREWVTAYRGIIFTPRQRIYLRVPGYSAVPALQAWLAVTAPQGTLVCPQSPFHGFQVILQREQDTVYTEEDLAR